MNKFKVGDRVRRIVRDPTNTLKRNAIYEVSYVDNSSHTYYQGIDLVGITNTFSEDTKGWFSAEYFELVEESEVNIIESDDGWRTVSKKEAKRLRALFDNSIEIRTQVRIKSETE